MRISVFTRHSPDCPRRLERHGRRCRCRKYLDIYHDNGQREIRSSKTRSWEEAERRAADILKKHEAGQPIELGRMTVERACSLYIDARVSEARKSSTIRILRLLLEKRLVPWTKESGLMYLYQIRLSHLEQFRGTWPGSPLTRYKMQERLKSFFSYCHVHGWVTTNPCLGLRRIKVDQKPTDYFTPEEMNALLDACESPEEKALLLLLRWSGLRISDALGLHISRVRNGKLFLYTQKTGVAVNAPLPPAVVEALNSMTKAHPEYYFWPTTGELETTRKKWTERFAAITKRAKIGKRAHLHMFRDTFAVEMLLSGAPLDQVSIALGHSSVRITEKHYAPFVKARQEQLERFIRASWNK